MATILLRRDFGKLQNYITAGTAIPEFVNGIKMEGNILSSIRTHCFQLRDDILPKFLDQFNVEGHSDQAFQLPAVDPEVNAERDASLDDVRKWLAHLEPGLRASIPICQKLNAHLQRVVNEIDIFTREMEMEPRKPFPANDELCRCRETKFRKANQPLITDTLGQIRQIQDLLFSIIEDCRTLQKLFYAMAEYMHASDSSDNRLLFKRHWTENWEAYLRNIQALQSQLKS